MGSVVLGSGKELARLCRPMDAINMCKALEDYRPFFIEDPHSPENNDYFPMMRQHTTVPVSMGELYNNPHEWIGPMINR